MGENSAIEWCDHTFNPWIGCTKVSHGCDHCYAEALATNRLGVAWGPQAERRRTAASTWHQPAAWNRRAEREGKRARVFCASLADVFDNQAPAEWLADLLDLIRLTPHLDWLLLTKRPQMILARLRAALERLAQGTGRDDLVAWLAAWISGHPPATVWLGTTVENQAEADRRIPHLLAVPAAKRFLSCEPLLGPVSLHPMDQPGGWEELRPLYRIAPGDFDGDGDPIAPRGRIDWVISGGESGPAARPSHPDWHRSLRDQCAEAKVPFFFKQWGEWREYSRPGAPEIIGIEAESDEAAAIFWSATAPAFINHDGDVFNYPDDLPDDGTPCRLMERVGKKRAGALLDGREHREVPA
ncbi:phage Gp37/Gp68 family protein [Falsiroseomonas selenitidurans]|uniref:Phage Gp37/Gp68 family protein n=1 Tax=Falsiroseomonas selenitidurans TaxID=2716335 RepID=A0ABX1E8C8_9PROT|nr:phage Gp37/Gp68 family protein [Falsiroseomonas selenitidurans]NKC33469.1 phage Gp37/Gp68 family protein [Falsiroseomonas selenitidurans]